MKASDWISVKDRLPNLGEYVFVAIEMKYDFEEQLEIVVDIGWLNEEGDFDTINDWNEGQQHFQVTHWQPIVLPRKEKL
jgi:hypothetical protein